MTQTQPARPGLERPPEPVPPVGAPARPPRGSAFVRVLRTTDHKTIAVLYLVTSMGFFMIGVPVMTGGDAATADGVCGGGAAGDIAEAVGIAG